jgi:hypothetical protein
MLIICGISVDCGTGILYIAHLCFSNNFIYNCLCITVDLKSNLFFQFRKSGGDREIRRRECSGLEQHLRGIRFMAYIGIEDTPRGDATNSEAGCLMIPTVRKIS